jgi:glycolate oxidase iron-sulfur subunit
MDAVAEPVQMQKMLGKLKLYRRSGIQKLVQGSGLLRGEFKAAEGMLKFISTERLKDYYPAKTEVQEDIQLFVGCMGESFDQQTIIDTIELLNRLGFGVKIDHPASCCGAMHHHNGEVNRGAELKAVALKGLLNSSAQVVVGLAGSCVARMGEGRSDGETPPIIELTEFLVTHADKLTGRLSSIKRRIAVHQPCTSKNLLKNFDSTIALLKLIPEIEILMLPSYGCCGASGSHMVSDTGHARRFLIESVAWLVSESPDLIISQNMGCMLHLTNEMATQQMDIAVIHPVSLLLEALPDKL